MAEPLPKYPEIVLLDKRPEIFAVKEVVATEKLHGSNARVFFPLGMASLADVRYGSRDVDYVPGEPFPLGNLIKWFGARPELLQRMWDVIKSYGFPDATIFGEAYGPGIKAKGVKYSSGTELLFRAFDIMVGPNFVTWDLFVEIAGKMELPRVHEVWRGDPTKEAFDALLEKPSHEGVLNGITDVKNLSEGVVIRSNPLLRNVFGEWLIVKHKNQKFEEVAHAPKVKSAREGTPVDAFVEACVTEGRVRNAVGRLSDRGVVLKNDMTDMPVLLVEVVADLHKECEPEWKATGGADGVLKGAVSKLLGPLYRKIVSEG